MGELFAVLSGKGGTGKTSVCAGIATTLAAEGLKVLCIDCDVGLRNLDISLGLSDSGALSFQDVALGHYPLDRAARHPAYPSLFFLTAPMNCPVEKIDPIPFRDMLYKARKEFDYIFWMLPPVWMRASVWCPRRRTGSCWSPAQAPRPCGTRPGWENCWS